MEKLKNDNHVEVALRGAILNAKSVDCKVWSIEVYKLENALELIENLKGLYEDAQNQCWNGIGLMYMLKRKAQTAKYEAIKEFTDKFEKRCVAGGIYPAFVKRQLDDVKKEMTEQRF